MATTTKVISIALTKEDERSLNDLMKAYGETRSAIIKRALILLEYITYSKSREDKK